MLFKINFGAKRLLLQATVCFITMVGHFLRMIVIMMGGAAIVRCVIKEVGDLMPVLTLVRTTISRLWTRRYKWSLLASL